jgi:hypothetical protein
MYLNAIKINRSRIHAGEIEFKVFIGYIRLSSEIPVQIVSSMQMR